jgi:hypothetical protein
MNLVLSQTAEHRTAVARTGADHHGSYHAAATGECPAELPPAKILLKEGVGGDENRH